MPTIPGIICPPLRGLSFRKTRFPLSGMAPYPMVSRSIPKRSMRLLPIAAGRAGEWCWCRRVLWSTGPIVLRSHVNLHIDRAAILQFTSDFDQYPIVAGNWEGHPAARCQSPLSGTDLEDIAITGGGIIDGNGDAWRWIAKDKTDRRRVACKGCLGRGGDGRRQDLVSIGVLPERI
jgi:hypothetical protein